MFGVSKGKVSEGIDLNDELCRAVLVIGVPYPPYADKKVKLK
jgi:Rad3-related DNA helicase